MKSVGIIAGAIALRILFVSPFILLFWWLRRSARKDHPRKNGAVLEFSLNPKMLVLVWIVVGLLIAFTGLVATEIASKGGRVYGLLIPISVLAAILAATPRTVALDQEGLRQYRWIRKDRLISWNEIAWMRRGHNTGATYVKSRKGGRPVPFSPLLIGQSRFEREVRRHTKELELEE